MTSLRGQIILLTGAGGGFGRAMTRRFLAAGSRLVLADLDRHALEAAAAEARAAAPRATGEVVGYAEADLAEPTGADALFARCTELVPRVDILVNNAGCAVSGLIHDVPREKWERLMQVNLLAPMRLVSLFLPGMIERRRGHIVNIASVAGIVGASELPAYSASKFGLRGFGESLAVDLREHGVHVTNVYPFFARTPILDAERYGRRNPASLPDAIVYDPDFIAAHILKGIERRRLHVLPGAIPKGIERIRRWAPWLLPILDRALARRAGAARARTTEEVPGVRA